MPKVSPFSAAVFLLLRRTPARGSHLQGVIGRGGGSAPLLVLPQDGDMRGGWPKKPLRGSGRPCARRGPWRGGWRSAAAARGGVVRAARVVFGAGHCRSCANVHPPKTRVAAAPARPQYGAHCRFFHPAVRPPAELNSRGLPLRPGEPVSARARGRRVRTGPHARSLGSSRCFLALRGLGSAVLCSVSRCSYARLLSGTRRAPCRIARTTCAMACAGLA
jgi:hypothetical protein